MLNLNMSHKTLKNLNLKYLERIKMNKKIIWIDYPIHMIETSQINIWNLKRMISVDRLLKLLKRNLRWIKNRILRTWIKHLFLKCLEWDQRRLMRACNLEFLIDKTFNGSKLMKLMIVTHLISLEEAELKLLAQDHRINNLMIWTMKSTNWRTKYKNSSSSMNYSKIWKISKTS